MQNTQMESEGGVRIQRQRRAEPGNTKRQPAVTRNSQQEKKNKYLGEAGCEEHALEELPHLLKKLVNVGPFQHVYL